MCHFLGLFDTFPTVFTSISESSLLLPDLEKSIDSIWLNCVEKLTPDEMIREILLN